MDLSINFDFFSSFSKFILKFKIQIFFLYFELSNSIFAKDLKKTQTQTLTQILNNLKTQTQT
jgi:hypothetical protein